MKKIIAILLTIIIFTGCKSNELSTSSDTPLNIESEYKELVETENIVNNNFLYPETAVYNEKGAYLPVYNGNDGSYTISYLDFETNQIVVLCNNLSCQHNNEECTAYIKPDVGGVDLELAFDKLIVFAKGNTINTPPSIRMIDLNGENLKVLGKFDSKERIKPPYVHGENNIYFILERAETNENGAVVLNNYLVSFNLSNGEVKDIIQVSNNTFLRGVVDNKFLMKSIEGNAHSIYLVSQEGEKSEEIYRYKQDEEYEFEVNGEIYLIDYIKHVIKKIDANNEIQQINTFDFTGSPTSTFIRIIDKDNIVVDNTVFDPQINDTVTTRYSIPLYDSPVKEITMKYTFDERTRPLFIIGTNSKYAFGIVNYEKQKASETDKEGKIYEYEVHVPIYGVFDKNDYFNNVNKYEIINYTN